ncbi:AHH domain-containing protein [Qipengyuania sp. 6D47A]|uniref:AHH domain-containing protein n=1 Tax=Qipengyuania qiaonensis TaxID=2867240 RepID=A0ABS7J996_9SPHN|nr:AHH domain-containing protein [Qipengyuania qiaonensis]
MNNLSPTAGDAGEASFLQEFRREAQATAARVDHADGARLNTLSAQGALPSVPAPAVAAHAPGAALAAEALPLTQAAARFAPNKALIANGGALAAGAGYLAGNAVRDGAVAPGGATTSEMAMRPKGMTNPDLRTTSDSTKKAMADAPDPCKTGDGQNHHIVPSSLMTDNKVFLEAIGFKLDDPANMIRLPQTEEPRTDMEKLCGELRPLHNRGHGKGKDYSNEVDTQLKDLAKRMQKGEFTPTEGKEKVGKLMDEIRGALRSGRYDSLADRDLADFIGNIKL